jgi:multisubunit Na+/H+ antiporter MnhB subunit
VTVLAPDTTEAIAEVRVPAVADDFASFGPGFRGWVKLATSFIAVLTLALVGLQFVLTMVHPDFNDPDIWWHLRDAQYLAQYHHFLRQDLYSFTVSGCPWVNTEWLGEIPFYLAYRALGISGLKALTFLLPSALMLLLLYLCYQESRNIKASIAVCGLASFLAVVSYGPRTILFGYIFTVLLLIILQRFRARGDAPLWVLPPLFCLWANTHGSWALGMILFFLTAISGLAGGCWGRIESTRWTPAQLRRLAVAGGLSVAALFVNPYGWRLVDYPFDLAFKQKLNIAHVAEWVSVNFQDLRGDLVFLLIVGVLAAALLRNRRWNLGEVLMFLFALHTALAHIRFLVLLGIVAAPLLAQLLDFFPQYHPELDTPRVNMAVMAAAIAAMVYFWPHSAAVEQSITQNYPSGAVTYMKSHPPQGNVLNYYLWGGYLGWNDPNLKVFVDSRVDIFEYAGVLQDYLDLLGSDQLVRGRDRILQKYNIQCVLFPSGDTRKPLLGESGLIYLLQHDPGWKVLYEDNVSVLMERNPH